MAGCHLSLHLLSKFNLIGFNSLSGHRCHSVIKRDIKIPIDRSNRFYHAMKIREGKFNFKKRKARIFKLLVKYFG